MQHKSARGFTLIELLVVIAIIAVLAAILFPVFAQVREKARATACLSNSRQIGLAVYTYLEDYDERYPQEHPDTDNPAVDDNNSQLENADYGSPFEKVIPYVQGGGDVGGKASLRAHLFECPDDPDPHGAMLGAACTDAAPLPGITSYLVNAYFLFGATLSQIKEPAATIYIAERNSAFCDVHVHPWLGEIYDVHGYLGEVNGNVPAPTASCVPNPDSQFAIASQRHTNGANYTFADGHAKYERYAVTITDTDDQPCFGQYQAF